MYTHFYTSTTCLNDDECFVHYPSVERIQRFIHKVEPIIYQLSDEFEMENDEINIHDVYENEFYSNSFINYANDMVENSRNNDNEHNINTNQTQMVEVHKISSLVTDSFLHFEQMNSTRSFGSVTSLSSIPSSDSTDNFDLNYDTDITFNLSPQFVEYFTGVSLEKNVTSNSDTINNKFRHDASSPNLKNSNHILENDHPKFEFIDSNLHHIAKKANKFLPMHHKNTNFANALQESEYNKDRNVVAAEAEANKNRNYISTTAKLIKRNLEICEKLSPLRRYREMLQKQKKSINTQQQFVRRKFSLMNALVHNKNSTYKIKSSRKRSTISNTSGQNRNISLLRWQSEVWAKLRSLTHHSADFGASPPLNVPRHYCKAQKNPYRGQPHVLQNIKEKSINGNSCSPPPVNVNLVPNGGNVNEIVLLK